MKLLEVFNNFIFSRELAALSPKSITNYRQFITPFVDAVGAETDISDVTQDIVNEYLSGLLKRSISKSTKATYIRNLKIFLKWAQEEYATNYEAKKIRVPKSPKKSVLIYTPDQLTQIFRAVHTDTPWITYRNKCIIALMYDSGLRQGEVCTLLLQNVFMDENRLTVHGKGDKERTVPLGSLTRRFMEQYLSACPYDSEFVFMERHGKPLTTNAVKIMVNKMAHDLPFEFSSHKLRHNFATNYCIDQYHAKGQVDIYRLMYLMGHEDLSTTQRYLHFAMEIIAAEDSISHLDKVLTDF